MASGAYSRGILKIADGSIDLDTTVIKALLVGTGYTYDPDHSAVDTISASEIAATNYTGGFGGAGRKTVSVTLTEQTASNRVVVIFGDLTWTALGGATNTTVAAIVIVREVTNDAASIPICYLDMTDTPTNGSDFTVDMDGVSGNLRFAV